MYGSFFMWRNVRLAWYLIFLPYLYTLFYIAAPDISNIEIPSFCTGYDPDYESSLSSLISGAGESLVSNDDDDDDDDDEYVQDQDEGDDGDCDDDDDEDDDSDDDDNGNDNDDGADGRHDYGAEAEPWLGQSMSAEQQLESLQSG